MPELTTPKDRLFVALDVPTVDAARRLVETLGDTVSHYKVGLELVFGGGLEFASALNAVKCAVSIQKIVKERNAAIDLHGTCFSGSASISARSSTTRPTPKATASTLRQGLKASPNPAVSAFRGKSMMRSGGRSRHPVRIWGSTS